VSIFRLATPDDIEAISELTVLAGSGMTTVPRTASEVALYVVQTQRYLQGDTSANRLLFVLEHDKNIIGISGIIPKLGLERPFYSFKRSRHTRRSSQPNLSITYETLQLTNDFDGYTELATILLSPAVRGLGLGRLLSLGRLAFIASHPKLFEPHLMADIRGWSDSHDVSPFWQGLTSKFIDIPFDEADRQSTSNGDFIVNILPSIPILLNLLPNEVSQCTGRPHDKSAAAYNMLCSIGFVATDLCDVFDGGPAIQCPTNETLISRTALQAEGCTSSMKGTPLLHYTGYKETFRATIANGLFTKKMAAQSAYDELEVDKNKEGMWIARSRTKRQTLAFPATQSRRKS